MLELIAESRPEGANFTLLLPIVTRNMLPKKKSFQKGGFDTYIISSLNIFYAVIVFKDRITSIFVYSDFF